MNSFAKLLIIGHRGASGIELENTRASFKKAIKLGVAMIEFDVRKCASGQLVVIHDETIDRTTFGTGLVDELSLEQIKQAKTKNNETIPTLKEALDCIDKKVIVNIEIKGKAPGIEKDIVKTIEEYIASKGWCYQNFIVSSFIHPQIKKVKEINPNITISALIHCTPIDYAACAQEVGAFSINVWKDDVTEEYIDDAHKRGLKFFVFTVNNLQEAEFFAKLGVDGIFTDYPGIFLKQKDDI